MARKLQTRGTPSRGSASEETTARFDPRRRKRGKLYFWSSEPVTAPGDRAVGGPPVNEIERTLAEITPRAAAVTLMLFDQVVERYERETGRELSTTERATVVTILRRIIRQDTRVD